MRLDFPGRPEVQNDVPHFLVEFEDDRARLRAGEAAILSVVFHILAVLAVMTLPPYLVRLTPAGVASPSDIVRERNLTFLELPPDRQEPPVQAPKSDIISDKDRIATSRTPTIDRKTLDELRDARRPGPPQPPGPLSERQIPIPPQISDAAPLPQRSEQRGPANQLARLEPPPVVGRQNRIFGGAMSAGAAIDEAARAAAAARTGGGGAGGDYGLGLGRPNSNVASDLEIMSDTMGVDFAPYLARIRRTIYQNWFAIMPESAFPPLLKRGKVSIQFVILKDGQVAGLRLAGSSGDVSLDRAAWGGITGSNPFPALPSEFPGRFLELRCLFLYNPDRGEIR